MKSAMRSFRLVLLVVSVIGLLSGCTGTLVKDNTAYLTANTAHCAGSEWADDSSLAVLPIPIVAFFTPHTDLNAIKADSYLKQCGTSTSLVNREVNVDYSACVPASLTRILTLGIWQWCPAYVSWQADVEP